MHPQTNINRGGRRLLGVINFKHPKYVNDMTANVLELVGLAQRIHDTVIGIPSDRGSLSFGLNKHDTGRRQPLRGSLIIRFNKLTKAVVNPSIGKPPAFGLNEYDIRHRPPLWGTMVAQFNRLIKVIINPSNRGPLAFGLNEHDIHYWQPLHGTMSIDVIN